MTKESMHELKPDQLAQLLSIGIEAHPSDCDELVTDEQMRDYFSALIDRTIPGRSTLVDSLLIFLREHERCGDVVKGRSLGQLLLDSDCELGVHETIKDYSKKIYQTTVSRGENMIAVAVYYAAIAAALVFHNKKISSHSFKTLETAFDDLLAKPWMAAPFVDLLKKARQRCRSETALQ